MATLCNYAYLSASLQNYTKAQDLLDEALVAGKTIKNKRSTPEKKKVQDLLDEALSQVKETFFGFCNEALFFAGKRDLVMG